MKEEPPVVDKPDPSLNRKHSNLLRFDKGGTLVFKIISYKDA
jgi:hypothetical protein